MQTIYKYPVELRGLSDVADVGVPNGAKLVDVQFQETGDGVAQLYAWFLVDTNEERIVMRRLVIATTGNPLPEGQVCDRHVTTLQRNGIVLHVFDGGQW